MPKKKKSAKYYLVIDTSKGHTHGAFEFNRDGFKKAEEYIKKIGEQNNKKYRIVEK